MGAIAEGAKEPLLLACSLVVSSRWYRRRLSQLLQTPIAVDHLQGMGEDEYDRGEANGDELGKAVWRGGCENELEFLRRGADAKTRLD